MKLKSGLTLKATVDELIQGILALPTDTLMTNLPIALQVYEGRWVEDHYVLLPEVAESLKGYDIVDTRTDEKFATTHLAQIGVKISPFLLHWIKAVAKNREWYLALAGTLAYYFHETHPQGEWVTVKWFNDYIGGRNLTSIFGFKMAKALDAEIAIEDGQTRHLVFDHIPAKEFFTHE